MDGTLLKTPKAATVLVVGANETELRALRFVLETSGYAVIMATDGQEAFAVARANAVDLVISDIDLGEVDGYALCKALRGDEALHNLPVILFTSFTDPNDVILGLEAGANNFLRRPFEDAYLIARVRNILATAAVRDTAPSALGLTIRFRARVENLLQLVRAKRTATDALDVVVAGQRHAVIADKTQMLDLLLSSFDDAVIQNAEIVQARDALRVVNEGLEARVAERTAALTAEIEGHRRAEAALRASDERHRSILRTAMDGFWLTDGQGQLLNPTRPMPE